MRMMEDVARRCRKIERREETRVSPSTSISISISSATFTLANHVLPALSLVTKSHDPGPFPSSSDLTISHLDTRAAFNLEGDLLLIDHV